jgi:hypothetical protein
MKKFNNELEELQELMEWHEKLGTSDWHKDNPVMQDGHLIAAMSYNRAMQIVRKHADKA